MTQSMQELFNALDLHDSEIGVLSIIQDEGGDWKLVVPVYRESRNHQISFLNCRSIKTDIHGGMARKDLVATFRASLSSDVLRDAEKWPSPLKPGTLHYSLKTSSGSLLDVVAEAFEITKL